MTDQWYYWGASAVLGPFSGEQLAALAAAKEILPTDTVWKDGVERGVPADRVRHLFAPAPPSSGEVTAVPAAPHESPMAVEPAPTVTPAGADRPRGGVLPQRPAAQSRAVAGKGAVIVGQDGTSVKFLKKCTACGHEDSSRKTLAITRGTTRVAFFCPKCKKQRHAEIHGHI